MRRPTPAGHRLVTNDDAKAVIDRLKVDIVVSEWSRTSAGLDTGRRSPCTLGDFQYRGYGSTAESGSRILTGKMGNVSGPNRGGQEYNAQLIAFSVLYGALRTS